MYSKLVLAFVGVFLLSNLVLADSTLENAAHDAISADHAKSSAAIGVLRGEKQIGLDELFKVYNLEISRKKSGRTDVRNWTAISKALDAVAMQKDAYSSGLYWYTDLADAKRTARAENKPILSLRLLGDLNEEFSCANSRFFRSILYSDPTIADTLRSKYILHWESVMPAPKITIEFGDGRKLVRTITGNSIHYVLDSDGRIIDALPGLYSPKTFEGYLNLLSDLASSKNYGVRAAESYRTEAARTIIGDWNEKLSLLGKPFEIPAPVNSPTSGELTINTPTALNAAPLAVTKNAVERPLVLSLVPEIDRLKQTTDPNDWFELAGDGGDIEFSRESVALMRSKTANLSEAEFEAMLRNLKRYVAVDTVQNEYRFHITILTWLNPLSASRLKEFNEKIYSDLFLTPKTDKWLGLYSADIYSAVENSGIQ